VSGWRHFETHHKDLITKGGIVDGNTLYEEFSDDMSISNFTVTLKNNFDVTEIKEDDLWVLNFQGTLSLTETAEDIDKALTEFFEQHIQACPQSMFTFKNLKECFRNSKRYTHSRNMLLKEYTQKITGKEWIEQKKINKKI
jgi:hypothetical protein